MGLNKTLIEELQKILEEEYGKKLDFETTSKIANDLVGYFDVLSKIYHSDNENLPK